MSQIVLYKGYPSEGGKRYDWCGTYTGPSSYTTGGDPVTLNQYQNYIDNIESSGSLSVSGTYFFRAIPSSVSPRATWKLKWFATATPQTEVSNAVDLSAEKFVVSGLGGVY